MVRVMQGRLQIARSPGPVSLKCGRGLRQSGVARHFAAVHAIVQNRALGPRGQSG
jgi:hypothetical protein